MRIATKYPRIAARYFERTGRQAEIVEVKGSVELAPLTGLVEGIVDLTATGTTLRENGLVIREEIFASTARLIANPVAHKLKAAAIDALRGAHPCGLSARSRTPPRSRRRSVRALVRRRRVGRARRCARSSTRCAPAATRRCWSYERRFGGGGPLRRAGADELAAALDALDPAVRAGLEARGGQRRARWPRPGSTPSAEVALPEGQTVRLRELAGARARRSTRPAAGSRTRRRW